jgi:putative Ca2+/H+ antiporter (TMEM165/GDT1 family)
VSYRRLPPPYVLAIGILGLLMMLVALIVEAAMGGGSGHRDLVIHAVQFVGALLVVLFAVLAYQQKTAKRR